MRRMNRRNEMQVFTQIIHVAGQSGFTTLNSACAGPERVSPLGESRGKGAHPQELTLVSDWGERAQLTHLQLEVCRVN
jgi:hypothetical protein